jgi:hypothetical protein
MYIPPVYLIKRIFSSITECLSQTFITPYFRVLFELLLIRGKEYRNDYHGTTKRYLLPVSGKTDIMSRKNFPEKYRR